MSQLASAQPAALVGVGLCTPLGLTARRTQCELAAGTLRYRETAELTLGDEPVRAARLTVLPETATRQERAQALATTALQEVLLGLPGNRSRAIPLFLAGPALSLDTSALLTELHAVARASNHELRCEPGWLFHGGRAAGFQALAAAMALLSREPLVLVGGVDSVCDPQTLRQLARTNRILSRSNPDGSLPGEGSGFLLISTLAACPPGMTRRRTATLPAAAKKFSSRESPPRTPTPI